MFSPGLSLVTDAIQFFLVFIEFMTNDCRLATDFVHTLNIIVFILIDSARLGLKRDQPNGIPWNARSDRSMGCDGDSARRHFSAKTHSSSAPRNSSKARKKSGVKPIIFG